MGCVRGASGGGAPSGRHGAAVDEIGESRAVMDARPVRDLVSTGIVGLDEVLDGGLGRGGLFLIAGPPGTGKTTLGNQLAYAQAKQGGVTIYATVLAETHARMLTHLRGFDFFEPAVVAESVHYLSLYDELSVEGLAGALALLRRVVREHRATVLVIDGASLFDDFAPSAVEFRRFTGELHAQMGALGCTTLLLADDEDRIGNQAIGFQVDGVVGLEDHSEGLRDLRLIRVAKLRGGNPIRGRHHYTIGPTGIAVFPRLESLLGRQVRPLEDPERDPPGRQAFGVAGLDDMLGGGLPFGSTTVVLGLPGTGKTIAGLHFVAEGARLGERGIIVSVDESSQRLVEKADSLGLDLGSQVAADRVRLVWQPALDAPIDAWGRELLALVDDYRPRRLFIDPAGGLEQMVMFADRLPAFLAALIMELRFRGVGTIFAAELRDLVGDRIEIPPKTFPVTIENAILLRYVELRSELRRLISVVKVRDAAHDTSIREFRIGPTGITVEDTFGSAEAVLSGVARLIGPASPPPGGQGPGEGRS